MLKCYLCIYIFIEYLKCVWKSHCIWIIRNDSKKKKSEDHILGFGYGGAGRHIMHLEDFDFMKLV